MAHELKCVALSAVFEFLALGDDRTVDHPDGLHVQKLDNLRPVMGTDGVGRRGEVLTPLAVAVFRHLGVGAAL